MTLQQHARQLLEQGHGNDGAIMCFIAALYLAEAEIAAEETCAKSVQCVRSDCAMRLTTMP